MGMTSNSETTLTQQSKKTWRQAMQSYLDSRALIMLFLGFSAGIPILLIFSSLSLWLREAGIDRSVVTMFSWAALGYSFKFIWAPLIDALPLPMLTKWLGRRRAWMLMAQLGIILAILLMASINPSEADTLKYMAIGAVLLGFSSATQDIAIDAYRIESAETSMQPVLSAMYTAGYRLGMIVAGAGALYLADFFGSTEQLYNYQAWRNTYWIMAGVMSVGLLTTLTTPEPKVIIEPSKQQRNQKLMGWYAGIALIPMSIYGVWYLINELLTSIFGILILNIPSVVSQLVGKYVVVSALFMPVALLFLVFNQPKFTINQESSIVKNTSDYMRLVAVFVLSVIGFVLAFVGIGQILPDVEGVFIGFVLEAVKLISSLSMALAVGTLLVKLGLVQKQVAMATWVEPILDFFRRYGKKALLLLALIGLYRISDIVAGVISNVFYQDMGFSKTDIANAVKLVGVIMSIAGGFLGGLLALRMRIMQAMMVGAILACVTNLLFIVLTYYQGSLPVMYLAVIFDNLAAGLASAVFIAFLSALTSIRFTAVQYAIFSSLMTLLPKVLGGYSGTIVDSMGYPFFFFLTFILGIPILALIYFVDKSIKIDDKQQDD